MHEVAGVKDRDAGDKVEAGCDEIEVIADANDVGVGVVRVEDGVLVNVRLACCG